MMTFRGVPSAHSYYYYFPYSCKDEASCPRMIHCRASLQPRIHTRFPKTENDFVGVPYATRIAGRQGVPQRTYSIRCGYFIQYILEGGGIVDVVVFLQPTDGLNFWTVFSAPILSLRHFDVDQEDKGKLIIAHGNAV